MEKGPGWKEEFDYSNALGRSRSRSSQGLTSEKEANFGASEEKCMSFCKSSTVKDGCEHGMKSCQVTRDFFKSLILFKIIIRTYAEEEFAKQFPTERE
jgi:hypothetical protein